MRKIFLVEGAADHKAMAETCLADGGFELAHASSSADARRLAALRDFDAILIEASLPDGSGLSLCKDLRAEKRTERTPILIISAEPSTEGLVSAFAAGADDYVGKPFVPQEIRARLAAKCDRAKARAPTHDLMWKAELRFAVGKQKAVRTDENGETDLALTPNEFRILFLLASREGQVLSRQEILKEVWGENLHVIERTVDKHICSLRRKMGRSARHLSSMPGRGYVFQAREDSAAAAAIEQESQSQLADGRPIAKRSPEI